MLDFAAYRNAIPMKLFEIFDEERSEQNKQDSDLIFKKVLTQFKEDLFKELEIENNPKRELLFEKALEYETNFSSIFYWCKNQVDLIR